MEQYTYTLIDSKLKPYVSRKEKKEIKKLVKVLGKTENENDLDTLQTYLSEVVKACQIRLEQDKDEISRYKCIF